MTDIDIFWKSHQFYMEMTHIKGTFDLLKLVSLDFGAVKMFILQHGITVSESKMVGDWR